MRRTSARPDAAPPAPQPSFLALDDASCEQLLARNHVARLAFSFHDRVDIEPIHYVFEDRSLYGRTSPGSKLHTLAHSRWVAIEVDEIDGIFDWRSVVAHGTFLTLDPEIPGVQAEAWKRGVQLLRTLVPGTGTAQDPTPFRTVLFRIHVDSLTGRAASSGQGTKGRRR